VRGIVDHNTIRLVTPLPFPEGSEIEFEPRIVQGKPESPPIGSNSPELYALLSERYDSGDPFGAERHNEHQP
jgi:hypothetical protein